MLRVREQQKRTRSFRFVGVDAERGKLLFLPCFRKEQQFHQNELDESPCRPSLRFRNENDSLPWSCLMTKTANLA